MRYYELYYNLYVNVNSNSLKVKLENDSEQHRRYLNVNTVGEVLATMPNYA
jgi:beta-galactosidase beta subunit